MSRFRWNRTGTLGKRSGMDLLPSSSKMHRATLRRDPSYDGVFLVGVRTTGVFCRPSCGARKPRPENVEFFASGREALLAGYRPCPRCRPVDADGRQPGWAERLLQAIEADFSRTFRRTPGRSRGSDCVLAAWVRTPIGPMVAAATSQGVCLLEFSERRMLEAQFKTVRKRLGQALVPGENDHIGRLRSELSAYFDGSLRRFTVPIINPGTSFQTKVWDALREIPYGETRSYQELARELGSPDAIRAVGRANGQNRLAIVVPCHRVINKDGRLGGYGGGLWRKRLLLGLEQGQSILRNGERGYTGPPPSGKAGGHARTTVSGGPSRTAGRALPRRPDRPARAPAE